MEPHRLVVGISGATGICLRPDSVADLVGHTAGRALDLLGIDVPDLPRWGE